MQEVQPPTKAEVEQRVREGASEWTKKGVDPARYARHFKTSINISTITYGHTHIDVQVLIGLFTLLVLCVDDLEVSSEALDGFGTRLFSGTAQLDPVLDCIVDLLAVMPNYFLPYACKTILTATIEFVDATLFDKQSVGIKPEVKALPYIDFKRLRNSLGGAYGCFLWDKFSFPDIFSHIQVLP
jgi:hypothetical protein